MNWKESTCACEKCKNMCRERPCWPSPQEAQKLIDSGYSNRLMYDYWVGDGRTGSDIGIISPAIVGYEGKAAPSWSMGRCTFLTKDDLCELHDKGLKPIEGRVADHTGQLSGLHGEVAFLWNNGYGEGIVKKWKCRCTHCKGE